MKTLMLFLALVSVTTIIAGCAGDGGGDPAPPPPEGYVTATDPATPPVVTGDMVLSGSVAAQAANRAKKRITLSSVLLEGVPLNLTKSNFQIYEGSTALTVFDVKQLADTSSKADIAFAVDSTGSMGGAITGVKNSIIAFADSLAATGIDVKFAGVAFWDKVGYDLGGTPPPNLGVYNAMLDKGTAEFKAWVGTLAATGGGDGPEVSVDAIKELADRVQWRPDAQSIIVGVTDIVSHQRDDGTTFALWTADDAIDACLGRIVVYTFSPGGTAPTASASVVAYGNDGQPLASPAVASTIDIARVAEGTGGLGFPYTGGTLNLNAIPLSSTISKGYVITFDDPLAGSPHTVNVRVNKDGKSASIVFALLF